MAGIKVATVGKGVAYDVPRDAAQTNVHGVLEGGGEASGSEVWNEGSGARRKGGRSWAMMIKKVNA